MGFSNAADARNQHATGSDFPSLRKGFGRTETRTIGEHGDISAGQASTPSLRAITDAYLTGQVTLSPGNPYRQYVQEYLKSFAGRGASNFAELARGALGHALNDALSYDASTAATLRAFGSRKPKYDRSRGGSSAPFDGTGLGAETPRYLQGG